MMSSRLQAEKDKQVSPSRMNKQQDVWLCGSGRGEACLKKASGVASLGVWPQLAAITPASHVMRIIQ